MQIIRKNVLFYNEILWIICYFRGCDHAWGYLRCIIIWNIRIEISSTPATRNHLYIWLTHKVYNVYVHQSLSSLHKIKLCYLFRSNIFLADFLYIRRSRRAITKNFKFDPVIWRYVEALHWNKNKLNWTLSKKEYLI